MPAFTAESGARLVGAMNRAFPHAEVEVASEHSESVAAYALPEEDDRHVLAGGQGVTVEHRYRRRSGETCYGLLHISVP